jgi:3-phenylpropionate/trans-cinnamate dioxygenase ferredoxin subunit
MKAWTDVAGIEEFTDSDRKRVALADGAPVCLFRTAEGFFAIGARCSHEQADLCWGTMEGGVIRCPLHGARFDLKTGRPLSRPAELPIPVYQVRIENDRVLIR